MFDTKHNQLLKGLLITCTTLLRYLTHLYTRVVAWRGDDINTVENKTLLLNACIYNVIGLIGVLLNYCFR